jgi:hypothetical protein
LKPHAPPAAVLQAGMFARQVLSLGGRQVTLYEDKIRVRDTSGDSEELPRRYTLTHNHRTAEEFLSIGPEYDLEALSEERTRELRDEVLAELTGGDMPRLKVTCLVGSEELSGKEADPAMRRRIFETEMPFCLAVIRYGDRFFFERHPELDQAEISVTFRSTDPQHGGTLEYGRVSDYRVTQIAGESRRLAVGATAAAALGIGALIYRHWRGR